MKSLDSDDVRRISRELDAFYTAFRCNVYYSEVRSTELVEQSEYQFWKFQEYLLLHSLTINWCEVFGLHAKNNHWKEITTENKEYTTMLYEASNFDYSDWVDYRNYVNEVKNTFVEDPDQYHHSNVTFKTHGINVSLKLTHHWLQHLVSQSKDTLNMEDLNKWPINQLTLDQDIRQEFRSLFNSYGSRD